MTKLQDIGENLDSKNIPTQTPKTTVSFSFMKKEKTGGVRPDISVRAVRIPKCFTT